MIRQDVAWNPAVKNKNKISLVKDSKEEYSHPSKLQQSNSKCLILILIFLVLTIIHRIGEFKDKQRYI